VGLVGFLFYIFFFVYSIARFHKVQVMCIKIVNMWELFVIFALVYFNFLFFFSILEFQFICWLLDNIDIATESWTLASPDSGVELTLVLLCRTHFIFDLCSEPFLNNK